MEPSPSPRPYGRYRSRRVTPLRTYVATMLLLLCALFASPTDALSSPTASSSALVIHRRRECRVDTLAHTVFTDVDRLDTFFDRSSVSSTVSSTADAAAAVEWTRVDTCGEANANAVDDSCVRGENVALVAGKLSLSASRATGGAHVTAAIQRVSVGNETMRLRVHAAFPVNTSTSDMNATIALSLPHAHGVTVVSLSVVTSTVTSRLRLAVPVHNWSIELSPPCPLVSSSKIHIVDIEWTPTRYVRWHWDGHVLHETRLPKREAPVVTNDASLRIDLSLAVTSPSSSSSSEASADQFHIKSLELQQVASDQDAAVCRPRVVSPEANCRRHAHFEPRLGADQGYLLLAQIYDFVRSVPAQFPPQLTKLEDIGVSLQNRSLLALCVGACTRVDVPQVLFTGMHHSREPISMMNLVYTIDLLALDFANGVTDTTALLLSRQLWFVLVVNPDGYARNEELQTWIEQRSGQRKNARAGCATNPADSGVDLNRNYDVCFSEDNVGSSMDMCGEDYRGTAPFSEPETLAIKRFVEKTSSHFSVSLNYHSFGRYFNVPFACKALDTPRGTNLTVFEDWAQEMTHFNGFAYGQPWKDDNLYSVNGETSDWLWFKHGIFAMSPEVGPAFSTRVDQGFWPAREDVPALAVELHYSNLVAARLAGPQYQVVVRNITRQLAAANAVAGSIHALLLVELSVQNRGLRTAGDVEIVLTTSLVDDADKNATTAFTTTATIPAAELGTVQDDVQSPVTRVLAIPETSTVHVVVRDALSCQYIRLTTTNKSRNSTQAAFQQWQALELPLCGFCRSIARDAAQLAALGDAPATCATVEDLVDSKFLSRARTTRLKTFHKHARSTYPAVEEREGDGTTRPVEVSEPVGTTAPAPSTALTGSSTPTESTKTTAPQSSTPTNPTDDQLDAATNTSVGSSSFASFASVPVAASLLLVALIVCFFVLRRRRHHANYKTKRSKGVSVAGGRGAVKQLNKRKNYVKVVNDEAEAEQLEDDNEHEPHDGDNDDAADRRSPRTGRCDDSDNEDAEYGRRRTTHMVRPRGPSDDDELV